MLGKLFSMFKSDEAKPQRFIQKHILYHYPTCPFCFRVRITMTQLGIDMDTRDIMLNPKFRAELKQGGGSSTVPCLRIEAEDASVEWLYESADINAYLKQNFAKPVS
ncbi:MAG: glutaredoxin [Enterobacterales bacterium]|nr:glutaredoxin [Enterobacterales bacterium]